MQAVELVLLLAVSLSGVCGNEEQWSSQDMVSVIRTVKALQTRVEELELEKNQMKTLQDQVQSLVQQQNSSRVAFHAGFGTSGKSQNHGPFTTATTIKFQRVLSNFGNGYSFETGLFTAPVRGVYVFHITVFSYSAASSSSFVVLSKNAESFIHVSDSVPEQGGKDTSSGVAVVTLEQGDTVGVVLQANYSFYDNEGRDTTFSGFLLFPL